MSPAPGVEKLLLRNDGFCYLISASKHVSGMVIKMLLGIHIHKVENIISNFSTAYYIALQVERETERGFGTRVFGIV